TKPGSVGCVRQRLLPGRPDSHEAQSKPPPRLRGCSRHRQESPPPTRPDLPLELGGPEGPPWRAALCLASSLDRLITRPLHACLLPRRVATLLNAECSPSPSPLPWPVASGEQRAAPERVKLAEG